MDLLATKVTCTSLVSEKGLGEGHGQPGEETGLGRASFPGTGSMSGTSGKRFPSSRPVPPRSARQRGAISDVNRFCTNTHSRTPRMFTGREQGDHSASEQLRTN